MKKFSGVTILAGACVCGFLMTSRVASADQEVWFVSDIVNCDTTQTQAAKTAAFVAKNASANAILLTTEANNCKDDPSAYTTFRNQWLNPSGLTDWFAVPGNHDYYTTVTGPDNHLAAAFHQALSVDPGGMTYGMEIVGSSWIIVGLDSELDDQTSPTMATQAYAMHRSLGHYTYFYPCVLGFFHRPAFSNAKLHSGERLDSSLVDVLRFHGADLLLSGHEHVYERLQPTDATFGAVQIVAGTGGAGVHNSGFSGTLPSAKQLANVYGVVKLLLKDATETTPGSYEFEFWGFPASDPKAIPTWTKLDSGGADCRLPW